MLARKRWSHLSLSQLLCRPFAFLCLYNWTFRVCKLRPCVPLTGQLFSADGFIGIISWFFQAQLRELGVRSGLLGFLGVFICYSVYQLPKPPIFQQLFFTWQIFSTCIDFGQVVLVAVLTEYHSTTLPEVPTGKHRREELLVCPVWDLLYEPEILAVLSTLNIAEMLVMQPLELRRVSIELK